MGCRYRRCPQNYHYACAVKDNCIFRTSGHVFCEQHHEAGMADAKPFTDFTYPHHLGMCRGGGHYSLLLLRRQYKSSNLATFNQKPMIKKQHFCACKIPA